jgi:hypothetical protein
MSKVISLEVVPAAAAIKVPALLTGDDEAVKKQFSDLFAEAQSGQRRIVTFGLFAWKVKLTQLKHSQFGDWVKGNFGDSAYRTVRSHMHLTELALKAAGIKHLKPVFQIGSALPISKHGDFLMLPEKSVPDSLKPLREKLYDIVDGKSARALFTELKQAEEDETGTLKKKPGRRKKEGGATKEQRAAAKLREEEERVTALKLDAADFAKWCDKSGDDKGIGSFRGSKEWTRLKESARAMVAYMDRADERAAKGDQQ